MIGFQLVIGRLPDLPRVLLTASSLRNLTFHRPWPSTGSCWAGCPFRIWLEALTSGLQAALVQPLSPLACPGDQPWGRFFAVSATLWIRQPHQQEMNMRASEFLLSPECRWGALPFWKNFKSPEGSLVLFIFPRVATKEDSAFGALDCRGTRWNRCLPVLSVTQGKEVATGCWAFACLTLV